MPLASIAAAAVAAVFWRRPIVPMEPAATSRPLRVLSAVATVPALVQLARLAVFMLSPGQAAYSRFRPATGRAPLVPHRVLRRRPGRTTTPHIYDERSTRCPATRRRFERRAPLGAFKIDVYEYPPVFLLLPRALGLSLPISRAPGGLVRAQRAVLLIAMSPSPRARAGRGDPRAPPCPARLGGPPTLNTLQKGNVQAARHRDLHVRHGALRAASLGGWGPLLAYATVSKLFPGCWCCISWRGGSGGGGVDGGMFGRAGPSRPARHRVRTLPRVLRASPGRPRRRGLPGLPETGGDGHNISIPGWSGSSGSSASPACPSRAAKVIGSAYTLLVVGAIVCVRRLARARRRGAPGLAHDPDPRHAAESLPAPGLRRLSGDWLFTPAGGARGGRPASWNVLLLGLASLWLQPLRAVGLGRRAAQDARPDLNRAAAGRDHRRRVRGDPPVTRERGPGGRNRHRRRLSAAPPACRSDRARPEQGPARIRWRVRPLVESALAAADVAAAALRLEGAVAIAVAELHPTKRGIRRGTPVPRGRGANGRPAPKGGPTGGRSASTGGRGGRFSASFTRSGRPFRSLPFMREMDFWAASSSSNSTKAKPAGVRSHGRWGPWRPPLYRPR